MKALYFDGKLTLREVAKPQRAPGEALIKVLLAGICGTDREILKGYSNFHGIPGHEFVGRVVECDDPQWIGQRAGQDVKLRSGYGIPRIFDYYGVVGIPVDLFPPGGPERVAIGIVGGRVIGLL